MTSQLSFAGAELCEPSDNTDRGRGTTRSQGLRGTGMVTDSGLSGGPRGPGGYVNGQGGQLRKLLGRALVSLATTAVAVALLAPAASASPIGDAEAAIMAAWEKAGGDS